MPVVVTAIFQPNEGSRDQLVEAFTSTIPGIHAEEGCLLYAIHDASDGTITMIEKWETRELLDAHANGAAVAVMRDAIAPFLESPAVVTSMSAIPIGGAQGAL